MPGVFILSAASVLAATGAAKIWSALGDSKFLTTTDPIIGIKFGQLMLMVGLAEIAIAVVCFFSKRQTFALGLVAWMSTNFVVYRLGLWWMDWKKPCGCLGNLTDALHISPQTADNIMKLVLAYLLIGSYGLLIWQWKRARTSFNINDTIKSKKTRTSWIIASTSLLFGSTLAAQEFSVEGAFSIELPFLGGGTLSLPDKGMPELKSPVRGVFVVQVNGCQWLVRSKRFDESFDYHEVGFDGTNTYALSSLQNWAAKEKAKGVVVGDGVATAEVSKGPVPHVKSDINRVLWLVFGSGCYLSLADDGRLEPVLSKSSSRAYIHGFKQTAKWELVDSSPVFARYVVFFDEGFNYRWLSQDVGYLKRPPEKQQWPPPYDSGFTNSVLEVSSFIPEGKGMIPKLASYSAYSPRQNGRSASELQLDSRFTVEVTNHQSGCTLRDFRPVIPGKMLVSDWRFERDPNPVFNVVYNCDTNWLTDEEVRRLPEYSKAAGYQAIQANVLPTTSVRSHSHGRRHFWLAAFGAVTLAFLLVAIRKQNTKVERKKTNENHA